MNSIMSFTQFILEQEQLNEASFNIAQMAKVADLIAKVASKRLGTNLVRMTKLPGLDTDTVDYKKSDGTIGTGYMYVSEKGYRLRIGMSKVKGNNRVSAELNAMDIWLPNNKDFFGIPTRSLTISGDKNIVQIMDDAMEYLIKGKLPKVEESNTFIGVDRQRHLNESTKAAMKSNRVKYAVEVLGVDVNVFDGMTEAQGSAKAKSLSGYVEEEYASWLRGFNKSSPKEQNTMMDGAKAADAKLAAVKYADPDIVFDDLERLAGVVASGLSNSLLVVGMGGLGKTYHIEKTLKEMLGSPDGPMAKWRHFKGAKLSPLGLYTTLFVNRDDMTIVFDDSDSVFANDDTINMLKSALDTYKVRKVSWTSGVTQNVTKLTDSEKRELYNKIDDAYMDDPSSVGSKDLKLPSEFDFTSRVIFISNLPKSKIAQPLLSRSFVVDVTLDAAGVKKRIKTILATKPNLNKQEADEIMEKLEASGGQLTMRAVETSLALRASGIDDWLRFVQEYVAA